MKNGIAEIMKYWFVLAALTLSSLRLGTGFYRPGAVRHSTGFKSFCTERNSEDIQDIIEKVKQEDADWLRSVFGDNFNEILASDTIKGDKSVLVNSAGVGVANSVSVGKLDSVDTKNNTSKIKISNDEDNDNMNSNIEKLIELGYSMKDVLIIKPTVRQIILERMVLKPKRGLPEEWLLRPSSSSVNKSKGTYANKSNTNEVKRTKRKLPLDNSGVGESFKWRNGAAGETEYKSRASPKSSKSTDSEPYYGDGSPVSFWPDIDEFKDMLLDESKWRVDVIGPWSAPLIRLETKWRYNLYRTWLQFLDEGIGDGFDEIPGSFVPNDEDNDDSAAASSYNDWISNMMQSNDEWTDVRTEENEVKLATNKYLEEDKVDSMPSNEWFDDNLDEESREYGRRTKKNTSTNKGYNDSDEV